MTTIPLIACVGMIAGLFWCWGSPRRNERQQHLFSRLCRPRLGPDINETTKRKRPNNKREITEAQAMAHPGGRKIPPWCA